MKGLAIAPRARRDLRDVWTFSLVRWNRDQADRYLKLLNDAMERLREGYLPQRSATEVRVGYLKLTVGSHAIYYRESRDMITVVRVLHQSMDPARHLGRR